MKTLSLHFGNGINKLPHSSNRDTNTIFRGNTLVSKCIDELMKLVGHHYLRATLKPTLDLVLRERKPCEIDPTKMQQGESRETNLANLKVWEKDGLLSFFFFFLHLCKTSDFPFSLFRLFYCFCLIDVIQEMSAYDFRLRI